MTVVIDESNWGEFAAAVLEAEAAHWDGEYINLTNRYGSTGAKKPRAAWKLGAEILRRRAGEYRSNAPRMTNGAPVDPQ